ncbi:CalY family protein [Mangrovibacillus cuniculi]|uniref:DUF11 domain-containing protein n=1 Tax=Mangrovibacillus cuniculi TaxID=2593652 RepID=A0A7S8HF52_9BACI|nr:CalY family protein [Mangrovibacillus cuniculi]QPC46161.1 hypothetical protein G8O30_03895 [Mangrovibacillus cuniculi]
MFTKKNVSFPTEKFLGFILVTCILIVFLLVGQTTALFTDAETTPTNEVETAVLRLELSPITQLFDIPNLIPGDSILRSITVVNTGTVPYTYEITSNSLSNSLLFTDAIDGLQVDVSHSGGSIYNGSVSAMTTGNAVSSLLPGESETLDVFITFPVTAGNSFQNITEQVEFTFTATQLPGTSR